MTSKAMPLFFIFGTLILAGCHSDTSIVGKDLKKNKKNAAGESALNGETDENATADEPQIVAGSFLTCARVLNQDDPHYDEIDGEGVGCTVRSDKDRKIDTASYQAKATHTVEGQDSKQLFIRNAGVHSRWNYFVYFKGGVIPKGVLSIALQKNGGTTKLSYPMEKIQESTISVSAENYSSTTSAPVLPTAMDPGTSKETPTVLSSSHYWPVPRAGDMRESFFPSMFCKDGIVNDQVNPDVPGVKIRRADRILEGTTPTILKNAPDMAKVTCFGQFENDEDGLFVKKTYVEEANGCIFMRDNKTLYIFSSEQLKSGNPMVSKENLEKISILKAPCDY